MDDVPDAAASPVGDLPDGIIRSIVEHTAHPFVVIGLDGTVHFASESVVDVTGWSATDLVTRNMGEFIAPEDVPRALDAVAEMQDIDRAGAGVPMVFTLVRPDGSRTWVEIGAMPLLDLGEDAIALRLRPYDSQQHFDDFVNRLLADAPLAEVLEALVRSIGDSLGAAGATVHVGFGGEAFESVAGYGVEVDALPLDHGPWLDVLAVDENAPQPPRHDAVATLPADIAAAAPGMAACWTVRVSRGQGLAPAVLVVWRAEPGPPLIGHRHVLARSARYVELALVRTAEHRRLRHLAGHDALTGVANRSVFRDRLALALSIGERDLAVAFCDLDGFKPVNDTWGHTAGDAVLVAVADRLRRELRTGDELARVGGDEFTVLLRNVDDEEAARQVAARLVDAFTEPFSLPDGGQVALGLSVGVVLVGEGQSADALLARADEALYAVKRRGGRGVVVSR